MAEKRPFVAAQAEAGREVGESSIVERILVADDDKDVLTAIELLLDREQMEALLVGSPAEAVDAVKTNSFAAVLLDLNFSLDTTAGQEGIALIDRLKALDETLPIIVMTGWGTVSLATQAMQAGAADFIEKPWENERLVSILKTQIALGQSLRARSRLSGENELLRAQLLPEADRAFIAESPSMRRLLETVGQIASSHVNILLTGENGTGKSLLARISIISRPEARNRSSSSTWVRSAKPCSRARCSGTSKAPSPMRKMRELGVSSWPMEARCSSMRSGIFRPRNRQSC